MNDKTDASPVLGRGTTGDSQISEQTNKISHILIHLIEKTKAG